MRHNRLKIGVVLLLGFWMTGVQAQECINTVGGDISGGGGSVSYSVGQVTYQTYTNTNGSISEGVQQSYEISIVSAIKEAQGINLSVSAYPNPTANNLILEVKDVEHSTTYFQLYDIQGKLLQKREITGNLTSIIMSNLVPATYYVKVIRGEKEVKTFKIIKK